ncbi:MAG TPA: 2-dehydropantoate 2-reductase [Bosea sp. (in: a-proteobacteria)]|jgi:2-dehydropantoate 2-reductase|uniref:ketopantoate reductase family protein n=1 Tax=Bosea sp. (in: a-proteobacteria) TaxID=1871050 RepID=UPI002E0E5421|nr:2-dehydropantoate 2-reductase [Bosea sp. (in: a-proteobacteria)]
MKIAIMGAGAVGCYYGAMLARAGHEVTLITRPQHVHAVRERGLVFERRTSTEKLPVAAATDASGVAGTDVVLFCVKSGDTASAGREMAPHIAAGTTILSLQNGVDNAERLQEVLGRPVIPTAVYVASEMAGPGHLRHHGRGELVIGSGASSAEIAEVFGQAGIPTEISGNVVGALWSKLIVNCAYNALSAIPQLPYGRMIAVDGVRACMKEIVAECVAVARQRGVEVDDDILDKVLALAAAMPDQSSSTAQDLARGKTTEIDHLNGYVVRTGAKLGIATPANRLLTTIVKLMEESARA